MKSHPRSRFALRFRSSVLAASVLSLTCAHAQDAADDALALPPVAGADTAAEISKLATSHPAAEALVSYLKASISNNHAEAIKYIDPTSIETFKFRTMNAVNTQIGTATLPSAKREKTEDILNELGFNSLKEMNETPAKEFYVKINNRQVAVNPSATVSSLSSVGVQVLGLAAEDDARTVHFVTRTSHREEVMLVSSLRLTSMIKAGREWKISLQAQQPRMEPLPDDVMEREKEQMQNDPEIKRLNKILKDEQERKAGAEEGADGVE